MNWDTVKGDWKQFSGKVKEQWGKLNDDELTQINGNREQLEVPTAKWSELRYGLRGQLEDHDGEASQA